MNQSKKPLFSTGFKLILPVLGLFLVCGVAYGEWLIYQEVDIMKNEQSALRSEVEIVKEQVKVLKEKQREDKVIEAEENQQSFESGDIADEFTLLTPAQNQNRINLDVKELGVQIQYPSECSVEEVIRGRAGSLISYDFHCQLAEGLLSLQEVRLYSESSIQIFTENCQEEIVCFMGYFPTIENYTVEKTALLANTVPPGFELKSINNQNFLSKYMGGPYGGYFLYVTYIRNIRIEAFIRPNDEVYREYETLEDTVNSIYELIDTKFSKFLFSSL